MNDNYSNNLSRSSSLVGLLIAASTIPKSFQKSLLSKDNIDQGMVTGLTMAISYLIGAVTQDSFNTVTNNIWSLVDPNHQNSNDGEGISMAVSAGAIIAGLVVHQLYKDKKNNSFLASGISNISQKMSQVALASAISYFIDTSAKQITLKNHHKNYDIIYSTLIPLGIIAIIFADSLSEYNKTKFADDDINVTKSIGIALGVSGIFGLIAYINQKTTKTVNKAVNKYLPILQRSKLPLGNIISLFILLNFSSLIIKKIYKKIENGADKIENNFSQVPKSNYVSGSKCSFVHWDSLSVQGRRHIGTRLTPSKISKVLKIEKSNIKEPIRVYIGLDSATTEEERVKLALDELERTGAYNRKKIILISPTGTGYVNYVMSDCVEYMSRGDCAQVTLQYSKRPSPLSLDRRNEGYIQYRMLINGINKKLVEIPISKRPKLVIFGESLGAWTSQDAFLYEGTDGFIANNIDNALWIGTPASSKWKEQTLSNKTLNTQRSFVGVFNNYDEYTKLSQNIKKNIKYFMITNDNDPVAKFSVSLLIQKPDWLDDKLPRPNNLSPNTTYNIPATFAQTLIDMKNALKPIPGKFISTGHDYRASLAPFIRAAYSFDITDEQFDRIVHALKANDRARAKILS